MEREPLLPQNSPRRKLLSPLLCPLPEEDEVYLPASVTPSELKERLIFGSSSPSNNDPSPLVDALTLNIPSPNISSSSSGDLQQDQQVQFPPPFQSQLQTPSSLGWLVSSNAAWSKIPLHRSKTAPAMATLNDVERPPSLPKPQSATQTIVKQAFALLVMYLSLGVIIYSFTRDKFYVEETHPVVDALYFCIVTMCTIGYGDITPNSVTTKLFSIMFVLVGFGFIDILLTSMVSYFIDLQENYLLNALKGAGKKDSAGRYIIDVKKGRMRIRMKVALALGVVVLCIGIGVAVMHFVEKLSWLDSFYLSVMSVTTVGYGDHAFKSLPGRIFASIWLLVSTLAVARAFLYLAEARVDKRNRNIVKWVLAHDMTISDFLAADIDNNGFVSRSEYVVYKLKEMGKVSDKDIKQICQKFDRLDTGNCGKISLADLMHKHPK